MSDISPIYSDYILGQHPIAFWNLDEDLSNGVSVNLGSSGLAFYSTSTVNAIEANTYNPTRTTGYYISSKTSNAPLSIIRGSRNATLAGNKGAILLPAFGFLNSKGKYNTYTFETWVKIGNIYTSDTKKLISCFLDYVGGTADDDNGLYFNDTSFILKIGSNSKSVYIKDFNKPMLIQLLYSQTMFSLIVNGEKLIELSLTSTDIAKLTTTTQNYIMLSNAYFDSATIYNYLLDKNQFILNYTQGLNKAYPYELISRYKGKGFQVDYLSAKYSNSIRTPNNFSGNKWSNAIKNNVKTTALSMSNNQYSLPIFNFSNTTGSQTILETAGTFKFKTSTWASAEANIQFSSLNILQDDKVKAFYIDGTYTTLPTNEETVFKLINKNTKEYFKISINSTSILYKFKSGTNSVSLLKTETMPAINSSNYNFCIGIDIDNFVKTYPQLQNFFNNTSNISVYVGGEENLSANTTLSATIKSVKFLNLANLSQRPALVTPSGTFAYPANGIITNTVSTQNSILGSYDLNLYNNTTLSKYYFTVGTSGYWKNHIPLQNLATYTTDSSGNKTYSIDFIQFNLNHAAPLTKKQVSGNWVFDTSMVKTYLTFENGTDIYQSDSFFTTQIGPNINRVVNPTTNWETTKYEIVDDFIIYMPSTIDISTYYIVIDVEFSVLDTTNNFIEIKTLDFISKTLNNDSTKSNDITLPDKGGYLRPYTYTNANGYNYKTKNPYIINKQKQQYLQLSRQSGLRLVGDYTGGESRGIRYRINVLKSSVFNISGLQIYMYYEGLATNSSGTITQNYFPATATEIFKINSGEKTVKFYIQSTNPGVADTTTGTIYSQTDNGTINDNLIFHINGKYSATPAINANEWTVVGVTFADRLTFNSYEGYLDFTGPISFDNVSYYQIDKNRITQSLSEKTWENVWHPFTSSSTTYTWNSWTVDSWNDVLLTSTTSGITSGTVPTAAVQMPTLYGMFTETNKLINDMVTQKDTPTQRDLVIIDESHVVYDATINQSLTYSAQ